MAKKTTRELIGDYIDLDMQLQIADEADAVVLSSAMEDTKKDIGRKLDNIDHFMVDIDRKMHLIDAEVEAYTAEIQRLKLRRKATNSLKDYFNKTLIPMVVEELGDDNGVYETDTARYKLYETFGPVAVIDEEVVPDEYKVVKMTEHIDKKKARADLVQGVDISGFHIEKVKRVRRS
jgi:hypothetical protein